MIKPVSLLLTIFVVCFLSLSLKADIVQKQAISFSELETLVNDIDAPEKTLVAIDLQDTLVTLPCDLSIESKKNCSYLGSVAWLNWQSSLLVNNPDSQYLVAEDQFSLLQITSIILSGRKLGYTEKVIPFILENLVDKGVRVMFVTQYDRHQRLAEVAAVSLNLSEGSNNSLASLLSLHSPVVIDSHNTVAACNVSDESFISYQNGVLYTSGQNKSLVLKCFLELYNTQLAANETVEKQQKDDVKQARKIIFIDDSYQQVESLYDEYRGNNDYDVFSLHYLALREKWKSVFDGDNERLLQKQAHTDWLKIKEDVLNQVIGD